jgi:BirA family transcriptional regulator, biotin operon repressor / biotin---[acetyl-CoA-carboxylase] ligase
LRVKRCNGDNEKLSRVEHISPESLYPLISNTLFLGRVHHHESVESTNTLAMSAADNGAHEGTTFIAEEQTAGRGRGGHTWISDKGAGIYCSIVLRPKVTPNETLLISMMAGIAVYDAVERLTGAKADLRWPNDVLFTDRKFCGILTESSTEGTKVKHVVIGIGINVNRTEFPPELEPVATSIRTATGRVTSRIELLAALLQSLDRWYKEFTADPIQAKKKIFREFAERSSYVRGARVHVDEEGGYDGITMGLDERGFLRVQTLNGMRTVLNGGVRKVVARTR